ncbi:uncharacterized protein [Phaseolus vulgaris]|uniref:uncharacterized protein n=1 Tax=Phaseolus vulgaris TaxID=3885 RepID=UPI0035CB9758
MDVALEATTKGDVTMEDVEPRSESNAGVEEEENCLEAARESSIVRALLASEKRPRPVGDWLEREIGGKTFKLGKTLDAKYKLKLNLEKCIFGVEAGKFLGFLLTERGIEANPDKCAAILAMRSPATVKEVQQLTGRMAALSRFVSASGERGHPYFQCLKRNNRFVWTKECEEAFVKLKEYLASPSVLCKPQMGAPLRLYFAVTEKALSAVLVQDQDQVQKPVYFVSKVLQGPEVRYQTLEKAALAVVFSARRLRHYFQMQNAGDGFRWVLSVDGSSNQLGSGAGIILEGPNGVLIEQSLRFAFNASNNQAEYEALIAGILLAKDMGARVLMAKSDSLLITGQVTGEFQAKDPQMAAYLEYMQELRRSFVLFEVVHVPREQNARADLLAKLASSGKGGRQRTVIQETLKTPRAFVMDHQVLQVCKSREGMARGHKSLSQETLRTPRVRAHPVGEAKMTQVCAVHEPDTWITPYQRYMADGVLPMDPTEARKRLVSDNGTQFASHLLKKLCEDVGTQQVFASVEHPQTNGQVESANRVLLRGKLAEIPEFRGGRLECRKEDELRFAG